MHDTPSHTLDCLSSSEEEEEEEQEHEDREQQSVLPESELSERQSLF